MPLYMDIHTVGATTPEEVAQAHQADLKIQEKYGVDYLKYWFNEKRGKIFCLVNAPSSEAAAAVHLEAHGLAAERIIEVEPDLAEGFLGRAEAAPSGAVLSPGSDSERDPGVRSILFTDIVGSTELTQRLGDEASMALLHVHDGVVREALLASGGREVKHTGDGIMAVFMSAAAAVRCATRIQLGLSRHNAERGEPPVDVRIGVTAGEPVEDHGDLFGASVQLAARLCAQAQPAQILVSNVVAELCVGKRLPFEDGGEVLLKGFAQPVRVHSVKWLDAK
jgi:class 3 adenylate cyclase